MLQKPGSKTSTALTLRRKAAAPQLYNLLVQKIFQSPSTKIRLRFEKQGISFGSRNNFIPDTKKLSQRALAKGLTTIEIASRNQSLLHEELTYLFELASDKNLGKEAFLAELEELEMIESINKQATRYQVPSPVIESPREGLLAIYPAKFIDPGSSNIIEKLRTVSLELEHAFKNPVRDIPFGEATIITDASKSAEHTIYPEGLPSHFVIPMLAAIMGKHVMYDGPWGIGKTTLAKTLSCLLFGNPLDEIEAGVMQLTPDANLRRYFANDMLERLLQHGETRFIFHPFLRPRGIKIADEINRAMPEKQNILLAVMNTGYFIIEETGEKVYVGDFNESGKVKQASWHLTRNRRGEGTFPLEPALLDRISASFSMKPFNKAFLESDKNFGQFSPDKFIQKLQRKGINFSLRDIEKAKDEIKNLPVTGKVYEVLFFLLSQANYAPEGHPSEVSKQNKCFVESPNGMDHDPFSHYVDRSEDASDKEALYLVLENGLDSARMINDLLQFSKAIAWLRGSTQAEIIDLRGIIPFILRHRCKIYSSMTDSAEKLHRLWDPDLYRKALVDKAKKDLEILSATYSSKIKSSSPIAAATEMRASIADPAVRNSKILQIMENVIENQKGKGADVLQYLESLLEIEE